MFLSKYLLLLNLEKSKESVLLFWDMQNVGREREHDHSLHCVDIIHFSGILADTSRCLIDCVVLPQQTRTKGKKKSFNYHAADTWSEILLRNYFWQSSFLPRIEYQNVVSIFPWLWNKFHSLWRLRSWIRMWNRKDQVTVIVLNI